MCMWSNIERAEGWRKVRGKPTEWQYMYICIEYSIFPVWEPYTEKQNHPYHCRSSFIWYLNSTCSKVQNRIQSVISFLSNVANKTEDPSLNSYNNQPISHIIHPHVFVTMCHQQHIFISLHYTCWFLKLTLNKTKRNVRKSYKFFVFFHRNLIWRFYILLLVCSNLSFEIWKWEF